MISYITFLFYPNSSFLMRIFYYINFSESSKNYFMQFMYYDGFYKKYFLRSIIIILELFNKEYTYSILLIQFNVIFLT